MGMISAVGLVLHPGRDCTPAMDRILGWAHNRGTEVLGLPGEINRITGVAAPVEEPYLAKRADLLVSLGGDGTMLRAMRLVCGTPTPVLGVNLGRLGFLAEIDIPELDDALSAIDEHRFTVESRAGVRATFAADGRAGLSADGRAGLFGDGRAGLSGADEASQLCVDVEIDDDFGDERAAFNDIALVRIPGRGSIAAVELTVEGHPFVRYAADAVIVATPTGSTAYNFSAGGPIVSPNAEGLLVTPVAPHSAFNRALFLSSGEKLRLTVLPSSGDLAVEADGRFVAYARAGDVLDITQLPAAARVVRLGGTTFYQRAQRRLRLTGSAEVD